ncbi:ROK family transcriptional regulator [Pseudoalteromonas lipolytica]|uniref:ROK family transcriptional regulator n=1 Tax=Pseudoalteromonas lipolytica TaxID=570156 RepID=A0AAD0S0M6_9GAMM|nr:MULTISPECIES: ROK family transcriptional regulator [Pseudoalteromonas]AXV65870.1 ROK family transcriptional regulator [Pseudoalteromonas donghaensis]MBE0350236.1 transcriptional regulator of PTS [Pseudoalteromonas lipolytica LMEB 39]MCC9659470.1 ROK family transcriptional regulator [Pseudoalteromonas sp. MB41]QPL42042.1 ROK family transcriptional regulator [Pseudoalteromonas sp. A41-2]SFT68789.1 Sugar kinase of the NBD/HSP70 family, may contain an N-terminal HTH domain [Pseudoalteromonas li
MKGSNAKQNKAINLRLVLSQIVTQGPVSRVEIARNTQLTKQTITNMVEELLAAKLVEEVGIKKAEGAGKPSKMLVLNKKAAYSIAIRVLNNELEVGLFYLNGEQINRLHTLVEPDALLDKAAYLVDTLVQIDNIDKSLILGVGLSLEVSDDTAINRFTFNKQWQQRLANKLQLPVALETSASACAAFQMLFGEAQQLHNFIFVHLGSRVESAVVYDRQILLGQNGLTGALGDIFVTPETDESTAELGRLNDFASITSLKAMLNLNDLTQEEVITQSAVSKHLDRWVDQAAEPLRIAIHTLESLLNTQTIIIGGDVSDILLEKLIKQLRPFIPSISQYGDREVVRLIKTPDVANITIKGLATLPLHAALSRKNMQTLYMPLELQCSQIQHLVYASES